MREKDKRSRDEGEEKERGRGKVSSKSQTFMNKQKRTWWKYIQDISSRNSKNLANLLKFQYFFC